MLLSLAACGAAPDSDAGNGQKILRIAANFAYPSLDAHKECYGWYTSNYGITETLFRIDENSAIQPLLAEKAEASEDGLTWTVTLKDGVRFSNGSAVTAEMAVRNLRRTAEVNSRFAYLRNTTWPPWMTPSRPP